MTMILKVHFGDNDFSTQIYDACDRIVRHYKDWRGKFPDLETIRKQILISAYGEHLKWCALYYKEEADSTIDGSTDIINYLNLIIKIEEVAEVDYTWDNSETCYLNFNTGIAYLI